jgi:cytochrome d ubiquinol oxidase subunit II
MLPGAHTATWHFQQRSLFCGWRGNVANLKGREGWSFIFSATTIATFVSTLFFALHPRVMPSCLAHNLISITTHLAPITPQSGMTVVVYHDPIGIDLSRGGLYWVFRKRVSASRDPKMQSMAFWTQ